MRALLNRIDPLTLLRVTLALLIAIHGWARIAAGAVTPFGAWLDGLGWPFGLGIAWAVTLLEVAGTPLLALGRRGVLPLALGYMAIYAMGIALVHARAGWFVVGLGRNGMEYSVLLIVGLLCVALHHARAAHLPEGAMVENDPRR
jgi:putative oxidoreductase